MAPSQGYGLPLHQTPFAEEERQNFELKMIEYLLENTQVKLKETLKPENTGLFLTGNFKVLLLFFVFWVFLGINRKYRSRVR